MLREYSLDRVHAMTSARYLLPAILIFALAACQQNGAKETGGTLIGAGLGALAGSAIGKGRGKLVAVAIGGIAGALIGKDIGKTLDRADRNNMQRTSQQALEKTRTGSVSKWQNPDSGNSGTVRPTKTFQTASGKYCREYQQTVTVGGKTETAYGTACRQPDGSWKIIN